VAGLEVRGELIAARAVPVNWARRTYEVSGPLLERLLLKLAINNAFRDGGLPIGGADAQPSWPTRELVEMVYGRRPIVRSAGLFNLSRVGQKLDFAETFIPIYFDNGRYREGCVWMFRTLALGVQFTPERLPARMFNKVPTIRGTTRLQPFNGMNSGIKNLPRHGVKLALKRSVGARQTCTVPLPVPAAMS